MRRELKTVKPEHEILCPLLPSSGLVVAGEHPCLWLVGAAGWWGFQSRPTMAPAPRMFPRTELLEPGPAPELKTAHCGSGSLHHIEHLKNLSLPVKKKKKYRYKWKYISCYCTFYRWLSSVSPTLCSPNQSLIIINTEKILSCSVMLFSFCPHLSVTYHQCILLGIAASF